MNIEKLEEELVTDEDEVLYAYQDKLGFWTIGVGQLIDHRKGGGISRAASRFMLREKIEQIAGALDARIPWWRQLSDARQRVLLNVAYNVGVAGLMGFKNMLAALQAGHYEAAAGHLLDSQAARQTSGHDAVIDSPETRYGRLAKMLREG